MPDGIEVNTQTSKTRNVVAPKIEDSLVAITLHLETIANSLIDLTRVLAKANGVHMSGTP